MCKWWYETYWSCKLISAYALLQRAEKSRDRERIKKAKLSVVLSLTYLGKYDFQIAEFARFTRMKFAEEDHDGIGWV